MQSFSRFIFHAAFRTRERTLSPGRDFSTQSAAWPPLRSGMQRDTAEPLRSHRPILARRAVGHDAAVVAQDLQGAAASR